MVAVQAHKASLGSGIVIRAVKERQEYNVLIRRPHLGGQPVGVLIHVHPQPLSLLFFLLEEHLGEPLVVAGGGGAALLHQIVLRQSEDGIHHNRAVQHRGFRQKLVNAPGARDNAQVFLIGNIHGHGAGVDIEHAAGNRGAFPEAGTLRGLLAHSAAHIRSVFQGRQASHQILQAEKGQKLLVKAPVPQVHQTGAGIVGLLRERFSGQAEPNVVLTLKNPLRIFQNLGLMFLKPV